MHRQEVLADDVEVGVRQQVVDVGDAAGERVLDRDHAEIGLAASLIAWKQSSKVGCGTGSQSGKTSRQAMCELAPGSPW